ncbi:MAG TPA: hypothetical protein VIR38_13120 [Thalassobaculum sp.]
MDFIERIFGISPDGGDGSTEAMYIAVAVAIVVLVVARPLLRRMMARRRG